MPEGLAALAQAGGQVGTDLLLDAGASAAIDAGASSLFNTAASAAIPAAGESLINLGANSVFDAAGNVASSLGTSFAGSSAGGAMDFAGGAGDASLPPLGGDVGTASLDALTGIGGDVAFAPGATSTMGGVPGFALPDPAAGSSLVPGSGAADAFGMATSPSAAPTGGFATPAIASAATPAGPSVASTAGPAGVSAMDLSSVAANEITDAGGTGAAGGKTFLDKLIGGAGDSLAKSALPAGLTGAALLYNIMQQKKATEGIPSTSESAGAMADSARQLAAQGSTASGAADPTAMASSATRLDQQGTELASYLQGGTLPAGMTTAVDNAKAAAKARIISNHASRGMPTDPNRNSVLAQELATVDSQAVSQTAELGNTLLKTGIDETARANEIRAKLLDTGIRSSGLSADIYSKLTGLDAANNKAVQDAIARFSAALGGTTGGSVIRIG